MQYWKGAFLRSAPPTPGPSRGRWRNDGLLILQETLSFQSFSSLDGGAPSTPTPHGYRPSSIGSIVKPKGFSGSEFFHHGDTGRELSRIDLSAPPCEVPHLDGQWGGPDQFRSRPGHPAQWRRINRGSAAPRGEPLFRYTPSRHPAGHILVAWSAPGTGRETPRRAPALAPFPALRRG